SSWLQSHMKRTIGVSVVITLLLGWSPSHAQQQTWSLAVIGDQQLPVNAQDSNDWLDRFTSQTQWMADNAAAKNLRMAVQVGDIVEHGNNVTEYGWALSGMQILDAATNADGGKGIPWSVSYGNHEIIGASTSPTIDLAGPGPSANYRQYFGSASGTHR